MASFRPVSSGPISAIRHLASAATGATLQARGILDEGAFGAATLSFGSATFNGASILSAEAFGAASLQAGAAGLQSSGIATAEAFGAATITLGAATFAGTSILSGETFGASALSAGAGAIQAGGIGSQEAFGVSTLSFSAAVFAGTSIGSAETFGVSDITSGVIQPPAVERGDGVRSAKRYLRKKAQDEFAAKIEEIEEHIRAARSYEARRRELKEAATAVRELKEIAPAIALPVLDGILEKVDALAKKAAVFTTIKADIQAELDRVRAMQARRERHKRIAIAMLMAA
jgi:hypothetical protein